MKRMGLQYFWIGLIIILFSCSKEKGMTEIIPEENEKCDQDICWDADIYTCRDKFYIDFFTRSTGWTGGDATYSIDLQDGRRLWLFGDTFIDQVNPDRSRPSFRLIRNSLVLQKSSSFTTIHGGSDANPTSFITPSEEGRWYWPGDGIVQNGKIYIFMQEFDSNESGMWSFYRTSIDLVTLNLNSLEIEGVTTKFTDPEIAWGTAILHDGNYTYLYGIKSNVSPKQMFVARVAGSITNDWEYYSSEKWEQDARLASPIFSGVSEQFAVFKDKGVYYLLTQQSAFGKKIYLYNATTPTGNFGDQKIIYCTPESKGDIFTYNAFAHPTVYNDSLLVSYNINSFEASDLLKSADNYRPYFVKVGNWRK